MCSKMGITLQQESDLDAVMTEMELGRSIHGRVDIKQFTRWWERHPEAHNDVIGPLTSKKARPGNRRR